jgi:hypothetical protein
MFLVLAALGSFAVLVPKIGWRQFCRTRLPDADPAPPSRFDRADG